jgi:hypothetical protein
LLSWRRYEIEMGVPLSTETNSLGLALVPLVINIVLFMASSAVAFFSHDPHPDFESLLLARNEAVARVAQRRQDYEAEVRDAESRFRRRRQSLGSRAERLQRDIDEKQAEGDALGPREEAELVKVIAVIGQRLLAYQDGNERMRHSNRPAYFGQKTLEIVEDYMRGNLPRLATDDSAAEPLRQYSF